jgi:hypothetical protein
VDTGNRSFENILKGEYLSSCDAGFQFVCVMFLKNITNNGSLLSEHNMSFTHILFLYMPFMGKA